MNAMVQTAQRLDDAILWLCVKHPPQKRSGIARILGRDPSTITQMMNRLRHDGYIDHGRGSCTPLPKALVRVSRFDEAEMTELLRPVESVRATADEGRLTNIGTPAMEPRGSIAPPLQTLVNALQDLQDPLLRAANAKLQARVAELEAENAELHRKLKTARERVGFALHGL